ncbi:glutamate 5-kinase [Rhodovibrionaceae bacterium A322]
MSAKGKGDTPLHSLAKAKRIVVKIGSALLIDDKGNVRRPWLTALAEDLAELKAQGKELMIVSSGAIAVGRAPLGLSMGSLRLEEKQAAAATGQLRLAHAYEEALGIYDMTVSQILLTMDDTEERRRHLNARNTLNTLLRCGVVPVINENDTVATSEIRFGDNDRLAARVAAMVNADTLILLSDIDGLYSEDPRKNPDARHVPVIRELDEQTLAMAGKAPPGYSSGGMETKLAAARIALSAGCHMAISNGHLRHPLRALQDGARCSWFMADLEPRTARKRWIAGALKTSGSVTLDAGALAALKAGKSLLPAGVTALDGKFERGDALVVLDPQGREVARGLCAYSSTDAQQILGHKSSDIEALLGYRGREELIHRDDLVLS